MNPSILFKNNTEKLLKVSYIALQNDKYYLLKNLMKQSLIRK